MAYSGRSHLNIGLNTEEDEWETEGMSDRGRHLALRKQTSYRKAISKGSHHTNDLLHPSHAETGYHKREFHSNVDWSEYAVNGDHIWVDTNSSGDFCYVGETECTKVGQRKKCASCKIVVHTGCISQLDRISFCCRPTFREAGPRNYREQTFMRHHWVHRRRQDGKCKQCGKSFQQRFSFQSKEIIAISCSWCKTAYHNKISCFMIQQIEEQCTLGVHASIIMPASWIIKMPRKGSFKSSIRKKKKASLKKKKSKEEHKPFVIKSIPSPHTKPLLVFINPKSGGNQGAKLMHKFQWLLNPRQVFDLNQGGPKLGLELFKKVPNLRILACGGDGTVGWILSTIDSLGMNPAPPVAVLPLGTGNDLSRTLNWGASYTDEPISKILCYVEEGPVVQLDRWTIDVSPHPDYVNKSYTERTVDKLPLSVMNNYFSLGGDAQVTLHFHECREANPEKFSNRLRNKMFYAGGGAKDLLKRSWRDLADHISVECDNIDITGKIRDLKLHCLLFLNIPRYAAGTTPWGNPSGSSSNFEPQRHDDGYLEVIGFTTTSLATLYVGGHGERLMQCQSVRLTTTKPIPMQVDGEPCRLLPSQITISLKNQANMIQKPKRRGSVPIANDPPTVPERLRVQVSVISMSSYESLHYDKERLRDASVPLGIIVVNNDADLETVRKHIERLNKDTDSIAGSGAGIPKISPSWCFVDSTTTERFFRIDRSQEHLHYVTDISSEDLYILDPELISDDAVLNRAMGCQSSHIDDGFGLPSDIKCHSISSNVSIQEVQIEPKVNGIHDTSSHLNPMVIVVEDSDAGDGVESEVQKLGLHINYPMPVTPPRSPSPQPVVSPTLEERLIQDGIYEANSISPTDKLLIDAVKRGDIPKVVELQRSGANMLAVDQYGLSCLHHAVRFGHKDICKFLLENAPPVIVDMIDHERGQTALHKAAWYQRRTICHMLVTHGASLTRMDFQGNTPRLQAVRAEDTELAAYLEAQEQLQLTSVDDQETAV